MVMLLEKMLLPEDMFYLFDFSGDRCLILDSKALLRIHVNYTVVGIFYYRLKLSGFALTGCKPKCSTRLVPVLSDEKEA